MQAGSKLDNFDKSTSVNGKVLYNINKVWEKVFSNFSCMFLNPNSFFFNLNSNCSNLVNMRNLQEQVKKAVGQNKITKYRVQNLAVFDFLI